jgi:protein kinase C substrate 80K-H
MAPLCRWLLAAAVLAAGFECDGNRSLPAAYVNDGYCDCIDRSDEPRTGACPDTTFTCANWPLSIPASHVGDGVCDCCDGSDEAGLAPGVRQPGSQCVDTCVDLAMDDFGALERGCIARGEMIRSGREARDRDAARLAEARAELAAHTPLLDSLRSAVASASAAEAAAMDSRRARLEAGEVDRALGIERLEPEMVVRALARLALAGGMEGVDRLYDMLLAQPGMEGGPRLQIVCWSQKRAAETIPAEEVTRDATGCHGG